MSPSNVTYIDFSGGIWPDDSTLSNKTLVLLSSGTKYIETFLNSFQRTDTLSYLLF